MDKLFQRLFFAIFVITILLSFTILYILGTQTFLFFEKIPVSNFLFSLDWDPQSTTSPLFGIFPLLNGTLLIMLIAMLIATPVGLMSAIYLSEFCHKKLRGYIKFFIELVAGIPTIVFGYFAVIFVAPSVKNFANKLSINSSLENALTAGIVMGIMIIPYLISLCDDIFQEIPKSYRDAATALGSTRSETVLYSIFPTAKPALIAVLIIAISKAIGETMIVTMSAGLTPTITINPFESVTAITSQIVSLLSGDQEFGSPQTLAAFALALSLFLITFFANSVAQKIMNNFQRKLG